MSEEINNGIPLPDAGDAKPLPPDFLKDDKWFDEDVSGLWLDFTKPYQPPRWTLSHDGTPFAKLGDLHVISGKAGHGKTSLMSQFMATLLKGELGHIKCELPTPPAVLYIDTEQSEDDTIAIKNRVLTLSGDPISQPHERFKIVRLRDTEEAAERWRQILKVIYEVYQLWKQMPIVVFLDGMLDIVNDYNDQKECQPIIRKCMMLVTHYNMSMWTVLHENPMADKMVGTLGSILQRKVTEAFSVKKHKHEKEKYPNMPDIWFEVQQPKARGKDQDDWAFQVLSAESWGVPVEIETDGTRIVNDKEMAFMKEADERLKSFNWISAGATYTELERYLRKSVSGRRAGDLINTAKEHGIIYMTDKKKYLYNGLKELPKDNSQDLPFEKPNTDEAPY